MTHSLGGGTGAGMGTLLISKIRPAKSFFKSETIGSPIDSKFGQAWHFPVIRVFSACAYAIWLRTQESKKRVLHLAASARKVWKKEVFAYSIW